MITEREVNRIKSVVQSLRELLILVIVALWEVRHLVMTLFGK